MLFGKLCRFFVKKFNNFLTLVGSHIEEGAWHVLKKRFSALYSKVSADLHKRMAKE